jgi:hypothetical protein
MEQGESADVPNSGSGTGTTGRLEDSLFVYLDGAHRRTILNSHVVRLRGNIDWCSVSLVNAQNKQIEFSYRTIEEEAWELHFDRKELPARLAYLFADLTWSPSYTLLVDSDRVVDITRHANFVSRYDEMTVSGIVCLCPVEISESFGSFPYMLPFDTKISRGSHRANIDIIRNFDFNAKMYACRLSSKCEKSTVGYRFRTSHHLAAGPAHIYDSNSNFIGRGHIPKSTANRAVFLPLNETDLVSCRPIKWNTKYDCPVWDTSYIGTECDIADTEDDWDCVENRIAHVKLYNWTRRPVRLLLFYPISGRLHNVHAKVARDELKYETTISGNPCWLISLSNQMEFGKFSISIVCE